MSGIRTHDPGFRASENSTRLDRRKSSTTQEKTRQSQKKLQSIRCLHIKYKRRLSTALPICSVNDGQSPENPEILRLTVLLLDLKFPNPAHNW
jgi:hypothetical protein